MMNEDEALKLAREGRQEGFHALYERFSGYLYRVALGFLRHPVLAEDVLQETFTSAFRNLNQFRGEARLKTWLYRILYHSVLQALKKQKGETPTENIEIESGSESPTSSQIDQRLDVEKALRHLPERDRSLLLMAYWDDLTCREIAGILEIKENHVKILLYRARQRFAETWGRGAEKGGAYEV